MKMSDKTYNTLKWLAMLFLPALSLLVERVFGIWGIPYGPQISDTIVAFNAMLAACLGISSMNYNKDKLDKKEKWDEI